MARKLPVDAHGATSFNIESKMGCIRLRRLPIELAEALLMNHLASAPAAAVASLPLAAEEQARADLYGLLAHMLLVAPDAALLQALAAADSLPSVQADNPAEAAWEKLTAAAALLNADAVAEEFDSLFVSTGTPLINPYASVYLSGSMMEKPLAALRSDLSRLGIARAPDSSELEDHLAVLCESMRLLIAERKTIAQQQSFFERHLASWHHACLHDIRSAPGANFYRLAAEFAQAFLEIEAQAFEIEETCHAE